MQNGNAKLIDSNDAGEELYSFHFEFTGDDVSVYVDTEGTEWFPTDFQGEQPQSLAEVPDFDWVRGEDIDF